VTPIPTLYLKAGAAALALALAFGAGWMTQSWRKDGEIQSLQLRHQRELTASEQQARLAEMLARSTEQQFQQKLQEANDAARKREITLRRDADGARVAAGGLRDEVAALRRRISIAPEASRADATAALGDVLLACTERYRSVAEEADRHASDVRTLIDAWPVAPAR